MHCDAGRNDFFETRKARENNSGLAMKKGYICKLHTFYVVLLASGYGVFVCIFTWYLEAPAFYKKSHKIIYI